MVPSLLRLHIPFTGRFAVDLGVAVDECQVLPLFDREVHFISSKVVDSSLNKLPYRPYDDLGEWVCLSSLLYALKYNFIR